MFAMRFVSPQQNNVNEIQIPLTVHIVRNSSVLTMPPIQKKDEKSIFNKRKVSQLRDKIETYQENRVSADKTNSLEVRNESFFESVWPGKIGVETNCDKSSGSNNFLRVHSNVFRTIHGIYADTRYSKWGSI